MFLSAISSPTCWWMDKKQIKFYCGDLQRCYELAEFCCRGYFLAEVFYLWLCRCLLGICSLLPILRLAELKNDFLFCRKAVKWFYQIIPISTGWRDFRYSPILNLWWTVFCVCYHLSCLTLARNSGKGFLIRPIQWQVWQLLTIPHWLL